MEQPHPSRINVRLTVRKPSRIVRLAGGALALALAVAPTGVLSADTQTCIPVTSPCQVCTAPACAGPTPTPPPTCTPPPSGAGSKSPLAVCGGGGGTGGTTFTTSVINCTGTFDQTTLTTTTTIGPATICIGDNKATPFFVAAGNINIDVATSNISAAVARDVSIPTLSLWALVALAVAFGAFGLRRLAA